MYRGYIKLWRKILDNRIFNNPELLQLWVYCLAKSNHKDNWVSIRTGKGTTEVLVKRGTFVFGRNIAAKELKQKPISTYKRLLKLKSIENLNITSNIHYSIVSICNWELYQPSENEKEQPKYQPGNNQVTTKYQPINTNNNDKNVKNDKKVKLLYDFDLFWNQYPRKDGRKQAKKHFQASVKTDKDFQNIQLAITNYLAYLKEKKTEPQFIKAGSTWFNNWEDWIRPETTLRKNLECWHCKKMFNSLPINHKARVFCSQTCIEKWEVNQPWNQLPK